MIKAGDQVAVVFCLECCGSDPETVGLIFTTTEPEIRSVTCGHCGDLQDMLAVNHPRSFTDPDWWGFVIPVYRLQKLSGEPTLLDQYEEARDFIEKHSKERSR